MATNLNVEILETALVSYEEGRGAVMVSDSFSLVFPRIIGDDRRLIAGVGLAITDSDSDIKPRVSVVFALERTDQIDKGDVIIQIFGESVEGKTAREVGNKLAGEVGSIVEITLQKASGAIYKVGLKRSLRYLICKQGTLKSAGLGLLFRSTNSGLEILGTVPGSAAHEGGLVLKNLQSTAGRGRDDVACIGAFQAGDVITKIDDIEIAGKDREDVFRLLSEPEGSLMTIALRRGPPGQNPEEIKMELRRATERCPCHAWAPVPRAARLDCSQEELRKMSALNSRHASCDYDAADQPQAAFEWEERWSDEGRDPVGDGLLGELGILLRARAGASGDGYAFKDPFFPHSADSLAWKGPAAERPVLPPETLRQVQWKRPREIFGPAEELQLWADSLREDDVRPGRFGNTCLLSALSACAAVDKGRLLRSMCIEEFAGVGLYGVKFFTMGRWVTVYVDDHFPCVPGQDGQWVPLCASPAYKKGRRILGPMLVEKAFAKLNWLCMGACAGSAADTLQYLTGCVVDEKLLDATPSDQVWETLQTLAKERAKGGLLLVGCSISPYGHGGHTSPSRVSDMTDEELGRVGLVRRNTYSIHSTMEAGPEKVRLVHVQAPWSERKDSHSKFVSSLAAPVVSALAKKTDAVVKETGIHSFWIGFSDFLRYFDYLEICSKLDAEGQTVRLSCAASCWVPQVSAGGPMGTRTGEYNPWFEIRSWDAGNDPITVTIYQGDSRLPSTISLDKSGLDRIAIRPLMDMFVYVRDGDLSEWELKTQLHGGPEGDRLSTIKLANKPRYEIMITAKEPGLEGAFVISVAGNRSVLSTSSHNSPDNAIAKLMDRNPTLRGRERWNHDPEKSCLITKKSSRIPSAKPKSSGPSSVAIISFLSVLAALIFAIFVAFGSFGTQTLGSLDFAYIPSDIFLQTGQQLRLSHNSIIQLRTGTVRYSVSPQLPKGLILNTSNGEISGSTPQVSSGLWNVSVNNVSGRFLASAFLNLKVTQAPLRYDNQDGLVILQIRNPVLLKPNTAFDASGIKFSISPKLPAELTLEDDGTISGSPVNISSAQNYDISARNAYTQYVSKIRLEIQRNKTEDLLLWKQRFEQIYYIDSGVEPKSNVILRTFTLFADKKAVLKASGFSASDFPNNIEFIPRTPLPTGLHINKMDGTITGTPRSPISARIWNVTVFLGGETLAELKLPIQILAEKQAKKTDLIVKKNEEINVVILPDIDCSGVINVTTWPLLPQNLQFLSGAQCVLSGKTSPRAITGKIKHSVMWHWKSGYLSSELDIEVLEPLAVLEYKGVNETYLVGEKVTQKHPTNYEKRQDVTFFVHPPLPRGLNLHKTLGIFHGSPVKSAEYAKYTVTVQNNAGETRNFSLQFEVLGHNGVQVMYKSIENSNRFVFAANESVMIPLMIKPSLNWLLDHATFDVFPPLPLGLKIGHKGRIEGIPLVPQKPQAHVIRMTHPLIPDSTLDSLVPDGHGQVHTQANFAVVNHLKSLCYGFVDSYYMLGKAIKRNKPQINEFVGMVEFSIDPKLPIGLNLQNSTGIISGTPKAMQSRTLFTVTAQNSIGDKISVRLYIETGSNRTLSVNKLPDGNTASPCAKDSSKIQHSPGIVSSSMLDAFKSARRYVF